MDKSDPTSHGVNESVAELLKTGKFSDLTLACEGREFRVHKAIVCARSPVWAAAVEGSFEETKTGLIKVDVVDALTLGHALTYLYTGNYDDTRNPLLDIAVSQCCEFQSGQECSVSATESGVPNESSTCRPVDDEETRALDLGQSSCPEGQIASPERENQPKRQKILHNEQVPVPHTDSNGSRPEGCAMSNDKLEAVSQSGKLHTNVLVFLLADYYQIRGLQDLAEKKFADILYKDPGTKIYVDEFLSVCILVYNESMPKSAVNLKSYLAHVTANHGNILINNAEFMKSATQIPELFKDAFKTMVRRHEALEKKAEAAEIAIADAKRDIRAIVSKVNKARQCGPCEQENNLRLRFLAEGPGIGDTVYSLQCRCGATY